MEQWLQIYWAIWTVLVILYFWAISKYEEYDHFERK